MSGPKRIYMVVHSYYDIFDIDSFWYSEEAAEKRSKALGSKFEVQPWDVEDGGEEES